MGSTDGILPHGEPAKKPSFATWLRRQRGRDDWVGDLAEDFCSDKRTRGIRTSEQLLLHMIRYGCAPEARFALRQAAREYRREFPDAARLLKRKSRRGSFTWRA